MKRRWYSFEGLSPEQKKAKARGGMFLALVLFVLMNVLAFLIQPFLLKQHFKEYMSYITT